MTGCTGVVVGAATSNERKCKNKYDACWLGVHNEKRRCVFRNNICRVFAVTRPTADAHVQGRRCGKLRDWSFREESKAQAFAVFRHESHEEDVYRRSLLLQSAPLLRSPKCPYCVVVVPTPPRKQEEAKQHVTTSESESRTHTKA